MANEISNERKIFLDFVPAQIEMTNYDELKKEVENYAKRYKGLVFDRGDKSGANQARTELLALQNAIEEERKNVKRVYSKPYDDFDDQIKVLTTLIKEPLDEIRGGLKIIEETETFEREEALNTLIIKLTKETKVEPEEIEINPKWKNKGNWTEKLNPTNKLSEEIKNTIGQAIKEKERKESELAILTAFCEAQDINPAGWSSQLEHRPAMEIIQAIQDSIAAEKEREVRRIEKEAAAEEAAREEERLKQVEEAATESNRIQQEKEYEELKAKNAAAMEKVTLSEAGPFDEPEEQKEADPFPETAPIFEERLLIKGTKEQFAALNKYLVNSGIEVTPIKAETFTEDDLPWDQD